MIFGKKINSCEKQPLLMLVKIVPMKPSQINLIHGNFFPQKFLLLAFSTSYFGLTLEFSSLSY